MRYEAERGVIVSRRDIDHVTISIRAESIRQERTGVHARLSILANNVSLAWSNFNLERDEERVRLTNSAHKHLNGHLKEYTVALLKKDVDDFVHGLWDTYTRTEMAESVHGLAERQPIELVLSPFLVKGGGTIFFAPPKRGKSYVLLLMAVSIDSGCTTLWQVEQQPVLFVNLERSKHSLENRLGAVNRALGLDAERPLTILNARGRSLTDIYGAATKSIDRFGASCVVLDSISRAGAGDLTENGPANRIVDLLNGLTETWAGIGHTPRAADDHVYGSQHFDAGADVLVQVLSQLGAGGPLGIGLKVTGENDLGPRPMTILALEFDDLGLRGARRAEPGEFAEIEKQGNPLTRNDPLVTYLLRRPATATQAARDLGRNRSNVSSRFASDPRFVLVRADPTGAYYGVRGVSYVPEPEQDDLPF